MGIEFNTADAMANINKREIQRLKEKERNHLSPEEEHSLAMKYLSGYRERHEQSDPANNNRAFDDEGNYKGGWLKENADKAEADRAERARQRKLDQLKKWRNNPAKTQAEVQQRWDYADSINDNARKELKERGMTPIEKMREIDAQQGADRPGQKLFNETEQEALRKLPSGGQKIIRDIKNAGLADDDDLKAVEAMEFVSPRASELMAQLAKPKR
jgi:hypothetical protein